MKKIIVIIAAILLIAGCQKQREKIKNAIVAEITKKLMQQELTSTTPPDSSLLAANPLADLLMPASNWQTEQKAFDINPFLPKELRQVPKPASTTTEQKVAPPKPRTKTFDLTGIIQIGSNRKALINGKLYKEGDEIMGYTVQSIESKTTSLEKGGRTIKLQLKEK
ncbi:hypothetical protein JW960_04175 [candidate division KSB1 bacterium]|nr:hypothetical protein [candidate division KSB1 bacterium]